MQRVQRSAVVLALACAGALGAVPGAAARSSRSTLTVTPAKPTLRQPVTLRLRAPALSTGTRYEASLESGRGAGLRCTPAAASRVMRRARDGSFTVTFSPRRVDGSLTTTTWCPGGATAVVRRTGQRTHHAGTLARRRVTIRLGPGETQPELTVTPVTITLLEGSTLTASIPERPVQPAGPVRADRATPLTGTLHAVLPGRRPPAGGPEPGTEVSVNDVRGAISPVGFAPDPLCPATAPPSTFESVPSLNVMGVAATGTVTWIMVLNGAPSQLFGCGPAGPLKGNTPFPLRGTDRSKRLHHVTLSGSVSDIVLPGGFEGQLAARVVVDVDLGRTR